MTRVSDDEVFEYDILWFAVDSQNEIAQFDSGVYGLLPESVRGSLEDLESIACFILEKLDDTSQTKVSENVFDRVILKDSREVTKKSYFKHSLEFSRKGLYSYESYDSKPTSYQYFRVSMPDNPLKLSDLPEKYKCILEKYRLEECVFSEMELITIKEK
ncbi:hypothetical protein [Acetivibrio cellulolyticus]|uniref:hypothetical protein n=1 Tax=Acetivibrio cellulolyticus TaxID=35830 RepID=UPI0001E2D0DF|nr:hypothetical protein [Acetivibrio cellulolyticus]